MGSEILLEVRQLGQSLRVAAVDAGTGQEVVFIAPLGASRRQIAELAAAKLERLKTVENKTAPTRGAAHRRMA